jgi:hypothetical protein
MNCNANIYFNRQCLNKGIISSYAKIKMPHTSPAATTRHMKVQVQRIKDGKRFLYKKKQLLNGKLYLAHLKADQE